MSWVFNLMLTISPCEFASQPLEGTLSLGYPLAYYEKQMERAMIDLGGNNQGHSQHGPSQHVPSQNHSVSVALFGVCPTFSGPFQKNNGRVGDHGGRHGGTKEIIGLKNSSGCRIFVPKDLPACCYLFKQDHMSTRTQPTNEANNEPFKHYVLRGKVTPLSDSDQPTQHWHWPRRR